MSISTQEFLESQSPAISSIAKEPSSNGQFPNICLSVLDGVTKYLGLVALVGTLIFYVNRDNPTWIFPWALGVWIWFILFNVGWTIFIRKAPRFIKLEIL